MEHYFKPYFNKIQFKVHFAFAHVASDVAAHGAPKERIQLEACGRSVCIRKGDVRLLSLLIMCMLRVSNKPTSQDRSEKVERNARAGKATTGDQETGTHTLTHAHTSKVLLATAKGCNTNQHIYDINSSRTSFAAYLTPNIQHVSISNC